MQPLHDFLKPIEVTLDQLLLDPNNPRFAEFGDEQDIVPEHRIGEDYVQRNAFDRMKDDRFDVAELRDTIKVVGYLPMDRIVVRPWTPPKAGASNSATKYVVVEGNRRVAALEWLMELHNAGKESFNESQIQNLTHLPALLLDEATAPDETRLILPGLRHVSGVKEWGPYQRARAVHALRKSGRSPQEVAQSLGLATRAANQLWRSYLALEQMRSDEEYGESVDPRKYSYFEEVMKRPNVRDWLGWADAEERFTNEQRAKELYSWIVGEPSDEPEDEARRPPKLREAKSIRDLSVIIHDESAMAVFRSPEGTLERALSRYEVAHKEPWQDKVREAESTLSSLTPDTLRAMANDDLALIQSLRNRIGVVLEDRDRLLSS